MKESSILVIIRAIDPDNAPYIIQDSEIVRHFQRAAEYLKNGNRKLAGFCFRGAKEKVAQFGEHYLTPASIQVGDGVTVNLWSDRYAATVIKVTKSTATVRRDKATLNPDLSQSGFLEDSPHIVQTRTSRHTPTSRTKRYGVHVPLVQKIPEIRSARKPVTEQRSP